MAIKKLLPSLFDVGDATEGQVFRVSSGRLTKTGSDMVFKDNGRMGIGTASPAYQLQIHEGTSSTNYVHLTNSTTGSSSGDGLLVGVNAAEDSIFWNLENTAIRFATNGADRLAIASDGKVGIGTASPNQLLHLEKGDTNTNELATGTGPQIKLRNTSDTNGNIASIDFYNSTGYITGRIGAKFVDAGDRNTDLYFATRANSGSLTTQMRIKSDGKVGIGTTAPSEKLHVSGDILVDAGGAGNTASLKFANDNERARITSNYDSGGGGRLGFWTDTTGGSLLQRVTINNAGNFGIGTTVPTYKLDVNGTARLGALTGTSAAFSTTLAVTGNTTLTGSLTGSSGAKLYKTNALTGDGSVINLQGANSGIVPMVSMYNGADAERARLSYRTDNLTFGITVGTTGLGVQQYRFTPTGLDVTGTGSFSGALTGTTATFSGTLEAKGGINLRRDLATTTGISFYTDTYYNWQIYMASAGNTSCGANGNLTAPTGLAGVTAWALRSRMEGVSTYGWVWETGGSPGGGATATAKMSLQATTGNLEIAGSYTQATGQSHHFRGGTDANWRIGSDITTDTGGLVTGAAVQMIVGGWGNTYGFQIFGHATPTSPCFEVIPNTTVATSITNVRGKLYINNTQVIDNSRNLTNIGTITTAGDITVGGDLTINGTTTTVSATNLLVDDPLMLLARVQTGTPTLDCGLIMERGTSTNVGMIWDESADQFAFINTTDTATTAGNVTIASYAPLQIGALTGTSATFSGALTLAGGHTLQNVGGDLEIQSTGDDINIVGSWIRIKSSSGAAIRSAWRSTGELTLGGDAQNTHMLKVVSGTTSLGGALTGTTATFSGTTTVHNIVQSGSSGSSFYATTFSRSGSGMTSPDIWDVGGTGIAIGHNSSTAMLKVKSYGVIVGGTISGTSATFSSTIAATELNVSQSANSTRSYKLLQGYGYTVGGNYYGQYAIGTTYDSGANTGTLEFFTGSGSSAPTAKLTIASGGTATFSGALAGTSATFSGAVTIGQTTGTQTLLVESTNGYAQLKVKSGTHQREWTVDTAGNFYIWQANNSIRPINVSADGNVGIGTVAPYGGLHVNASNYAESPTINKAILVSDSADVTKYLILTYHASADVGIIQGLDDSTAWKNVAINPNGGNVGIGTTLPQQSLQVGAVDTANDGVRVTNAGSLNNKSVLGFGGSYIQPMAAVGGVVESAVGFTAGGLYFSTRTATSDTVPTERMRITSAGKVGIGTTVPSRLFDVNGTSYFRDDIYFGNTVLNPVSGFNTQIGMGWDKSTGEFQIAASSTTALQVGRITTTGVIQQWRYAGTVVAAVESSGQIQSVGGALSAPSFAFTNDTDTGMSRPTTNALNFITAGAERVRIDANGKVGIGTTAPSAKIHVAGTGDVARIGDNHWRGTNAVTVGTTYVTGVTVNLANHKSGYLKVIISGDWSGHSAIGFMAEYFIQKGSTARYSQPGTVIREVTNQHNSDFITSQILDPTLNDGNADFAIQFKTNTGSVSCTVMYEFTGIANSVT